MRHNCFQYRRVRRCCELQLLVLLRQCDIRGRQPLILDMRLSQLQLQHRIVRLTRRRCRYDAVRSVSLSLLTFDFLRMRSISPYPHVHRILIRVRVIIADVADEQRLHGDVRLDQPQKVGDAARRDAAGR